MSAIFHTIYQEPGTTQIFKGNARPWIDFASRQNSSEFKVYAGIDRLLHQSNEWYLFFRMSGISSGYQYGLEGHKYKMPERSPSEEARYTKAQNKVYKEKRDMEETNRFLHIGAQQKARYQHDLMLKTKPQILGQQQEAEESTIDTTQPEIGPTATSDYTEISVAITPSYSTSPSPHFQSNDAQMANNIVTSGHKEASGLATPSHSAYPPPHFQSGHGSQISAPAPVLPVQPSTSSTLNMNIDSVPQSCYIIPDNIKISEAKQVDRDDETTSEEEEASESSEEDIIIEQKQKTSILKRKFQASPTKNTSGGKTRLFKSKSIVASSEDEDESQASEVYLIYLFLLVASDTFH